MDTKALRQLTYGLYLVTARDADGRAMGCVVNTGMQLTSRPYRVTVAVNKENATRGAIERSGRFALTCLTQDATMDLIGTFGFRSSADTDKFAAFEIAETPAGVPYVRTAASSVIGCKVVAALEVGTHVLFVSEVEDAEVFATDAEPMTYAYYHTVLKGTTPPKASAFIADEPAGQGSAPAAAPAAVPAAAAAPAAPAPAAAPAQHHFRCLLCGYIVETCDDELPEGFRCPMCGAGREMFKKVD